jgi:hypothetical protein
VPAGAESNADASKPIEPSPQEQNDMKLLAVLQTGLPDIITHGPEKKSDPVMLAKLVMDGLPEDDAGLNDAFYQLIQSPAEEFLAKLAIVDARAREHAVWFESFRVALLGEFEPDERVPQVQP